MVALGCSVIQLRRQLEKTGVDKNIFSCSRPSYSWIILFQYFLSILKFLDKQLSQAAFCVMVAFFPSAKTKIIK